jgi:hypothetical protein
MTASRVLGESVDSRAVPLSKLQPPILFQNVRVSCK